MLVKLKLLSKVSFILGIIAACLINFSCRSPKEPIKIGFVATLSGKFSDHGISGRNGAILAVEEYNEKGGIKGRPVVLIVKDDKNDPATAVQVDKELIEEGVKAIVGHMTSEMSLAAYTLVNESKILMISPTSSTPLLSNKDDWFFRVTGTSIETAQRLAKYAIEVGQRFVAVYSPYNMGYCEPYLAHFKETLESLGGALVTSKALYKSDEGAFDMVAMEILAAKPEGILLILSATEAAKMSQQIRKLNLEVPILSSGWAMTPDFITYGGRAAEGVVFSEFYNPSINTKEMAQFKEKYKKRFGSELSRGALFGYEACKVVLDALSKKADSKELKDTIISMKKFSSPAGDFEINEFGDVLRPAFLIKVWNREFIILK